MAKKNTKKHEERIKRISIVVPVYNEEKNIPLIYKEVLDVWERMEELYGHKYDYEIIFVDDGSTDGSGAIMEILSAKNKRVKFLQFSRNFGKEATLSAGIHCATGDAVLTIDSDLQHPVNLIPEFIKKWENGADVVIGVRKQTNGHGLFRKIGSWLFYKTMNLISETKISRNETDFRLMDRVVADAFNALTEKDRLTRGLINWLGFKRDYIQFSALGRQNGRSAYGKMKLLKLALTGFISNSLFPLKFAGYLGVYIMFIDGLLGIFIFTEKYILNDPLNLAFSGPAILAVINIFLIGLVLSCFGLIALYIGNINGEVMNRPMYVIRRKKI